MKQAERYLAEGLHPRVIAEGYDLAKDKVSGNFGGVGPYFGGKWPMILGCLWYGLCMFSGFVCVGLLFLDADPLLAAWTPARPTKPNQPNPTNAIIQSHKIYKQVLEFLEAFKVAQPDIHHDRELLLSVARTSLRTKLSEEVRGFGVYF